MSGRILMCMWSLGPFETADWVPKNLCGQLGGL